MSRLRFKRDSGLKPSNRYCPDNIGTVGQSAFLCTINFNERRLTPFATGTGKIPPLGMPKINITISRDDTVYASTCVNTVSLPNFENADYDTLKVVMDGIIIKDDFTSM